MPWGPQCALLEHCCPTVNIAGGLRWVTALTWCHYLVKRLPSPGSVSRLRRNGRPIRSQHNYCHSYHYLGYARVVYPGTRLVTRSRLPFRRVAAGSLTPHCVAAWLCSCSPEEGHHDRSSPQPADGAPIALSDLAAESYYGRFTAGIFHIAAELSWTRADYPCVWRPHAHNHSRTASQL